MIAVGFIALLLASPVTAACPVAMDPPGADAAVPSDPEAARIEAEKALRAMIDAYRDPRGVEVAMEVTVAAANDAASGSAPAVRAKAIFGGDRRAHLAFRDLQLRLSGGRIVATHDSNPLAYLDVSDNGSPYYALFNAFRAGLPFPELALALGEDAVDEVCMQLMPQLPEVVPVEVRDGEFEGQACRELVLRSEDGGQQLGLMFDPETHLVEGAVAELRKGGLVEEGATLRWTLRSTAKRPANPPTPESFALDVEGKQRVDGLAALEVRRPEAIADRDVPSLKAGEPAPTIALPRVGGGEWRLVDQRGTPVVVDFWATWCGPCKAALPKLGELAREYQGEIALMMVNSGERSAPAEREDAIRKVFAERKVDLPCVMDMDGDTARKWLIRAFPTTFLIDGEGRIAGVWEGNTPQNERELRARIVELLEKAGGADAEAGDGARATPPK